VTELIRPSKRFESSYAEAVTEVFEASWGRQPSPSELATQVAVTRAFDDNFAGLKLPDQVPGSTFWLVEDDTYLGRVDIRHRLNDELRRRGGHIGFEIRPSVRRQGYGRLALHLGLVECRRLDIDRVLVTCNVTNIASRRIIEVNGGVLEDVVSLGSDGLEEMRYWIDVPR
jgi:predicted acetyltransferase